MTLENYNPYQSSFGLIVRINVKLLLSLSFTYVAWLIWPDTALGWGWGFLSNCLLLSASVCSSKPQKE